jgi:choline dehydrogenase-like flavoprotein
MLIDAATVPNGTLLISDVCVIGAGAAGITIARDLANSPHRTILLESGPYDFSEAADDLDAGRSIGRSYMDLRSCRQRFFGGTTNHWSGTCLPLEPIDFERGWPFPRAELEPFYRPAQEILQLGPYDYRVADWGVDRPANPTWAPSWRCAVREAGTAMAIASPISSALWRISAMPGAICFDACSCGRRSRPERCR